MQGEFCKFRKNFQLQICLAVTCVLCALKKMRQATCLLTFRVVPHALVQSIALPCFFKKTQHIKPVLRLLFLLCGTDLNFNKWQKCSQKRKQIATTFSPSEFCPVCTKHCLAVLFQKNVIHQTCVATFVSALQYRPELQQVAKVQSKAKTNCNNFFAVRVDMPCKQ